MVLNLSQKKQFKEWQAELLEWRIQMARRSICVTRHGWFVYALEVDARPMTQNG